MNAAAAQDLVIRPEAAWAQVTLFVPVREPSPVTGRLDGPVWRESVAEFPVRNQPGKQTDQEWRSVHIARGARITLYGQRWSTVLPVPAELSKLRRADGSLVTLTAGQLEFVPTGILPDFGPGGILVVHAQMSCTPTPGPEPDALHPPPHDQLPVRWLAAAIKGLARPTPGELPGASPFVVGWGLSLVREPEILVAVNLAAGATTMRSLRPAPVPATSWDALSYWTWSLARATVPATSQLRHPAAPATPGRAVLPPRRLAIIDRSGVAIMATEPVGAVPEVTQALSDFISVFQSLYTDVLVLGFLQLLVAAEVGARLDTLSDPAEHPREFHRIESRMRLLHNRFWRASVTPWPWLDEILSCFQEENELPKLVAQLRDTVHDFGDQIERNYQHGLNQIVLLLGILGFLGVVAGIFASVAAFMTVLGTGHWGAIVGIIATSGGILALMAAAALLLRRWGWPERSPYLLRRR